MIPQTLADWLRYQERIHPKTIELGLDRVAEVRDRLQLKPDFSIVTVGGTNGKGSTCAMLEAILHRAGYRVGCYTSPHLLDYNERVRIGQRNASDQALCEAFAAVEQARGDIALTYFEFGTLAAIWIFCRAGLQAAILEVGLGGRLDAVNAFDADCAIVTSVALDHQDYLGDNLETIGFEKAGIFRPGRPAIFSDPCLPQSVDRHAKTIGAKLLLGGKDFGCKRMHGQWQYWGPRGKYHALPFPALRGAYQLRNASGALAALAELKDVLPIAVQDVKRGLLEVELAARLQVLPGRPALVLDVAHNPHAALMLADGLGDMGFFQNTLAVFSMLRDKDARGVIDAVKHRVDAWYVGGVDSARAANVDWLAAQITDLAPSATIHTFASVGAAYQSAWEAAGQNDRIIVFGSFYTVAEVLRTRDAATVNLR
jgi:dihydrofolate synthase/folylpolyglutamate synthase